MGDFDIHLSMNGTQNELTDNYVDLEYNNQKQNYLNFDADNEDVETKNKPFADTLNRLTKDFKQITGFKTNEQKQKEKEKQMAEKGTKVKILGMNPFVAISLAFVLIIGGSIAVAKIKK